MIRELALAMVPSLLGPTEFQAEAKDKGLGRPKLPAPREADLRPIMAKPDKKSAAALKKAEAADKAAAQLLTRSSRSTTAMTWQSTCCIGTSAGAAAQADGGAGDVVKARR